MHRTTPLLALLIVCGCGSAAGTSGQPSAPAASPVALSCTASGDASPSWPSPQAASATTPSIVSAVASGDALQLVFVAGTPQFSVEPQSSPNFTVDPSGRPIRLAGTVGVKIVLRGFRGDRSNYDGQASMTSSGPLLLQASKIGDFEGVVSFGAGVSAPACANVTAAGSTLTFHFIHAQ
jgi:hypothetical protein